MLNIKVTSDMHGLLPEIDNVDLLLICGDICPVINHDYLFQRMWINEDFVTWVNDLNFNNEFSKVIIIPGNHDFYFENMDFYEMKRVELKCNGRLKILINDGCEYEYLTDDGIKALSIYGTPYCKNFFNWAFMKEDAGLEKEYEKIPYNLDILMTHDAPDINNAGMILEGRHKGTNAGNKILANEILKKKPKYVFCGHIHSGNHELGEVDGIKIANVSLINEKYKEAYKIFEFEM